MKPQIDNKLLQLIVDEVVTMNLRGEKPLTGVMAKRISEEGEYVEAGLKFTLQDGLYTQLYAGLAVLVRSTSQYVETTSRGGNDTQNFRALVGAVHEEEYPLYGRNAFPSFPSSKDLPVEAALLDIAPMDRGEPFNLASYTDPSLIHEWNVKPGKRFLVKLRDSSDVRKAVCAVAGPSDFVEEVSKNVTAGSAAIVAEAILSATFSAATLWYPLAVFAAVYILNQSFKAYCSSHE